MTTAVAPARPSGNHVAPADASSPASVSQRAVLVSLHIKNWSETATDVTATQQVAETNQVAPGLRPLHQAAP